MSGAGSVMASDIGLTLGPEDELDEAAAQSSGRSDGPRAIGRASLSNEASGQAAAASDAQRLRAMMSAHFSFIWRTLARLGVPSADVDDCTQQVFVVASRRLSVITAGSEQSFLFGTALNVAAEARRTNARRRDVLTTDASDVLDVLDTRALPDELLDRARARELLDKVLGAMPLDLRAAFVLYELEEMPIHKIAALLGIPTGTAASRLRRARTEFQRLAARLNTSGALHGGRR